MTVALLRVTLIKGKLKSRSILMQSQGKKILISYHNIAEVEVELKEKLLIQTRELKEDTHKQHHYQRSGDDQTKSFKLSSRKMRRIQ